MFDDPIPKKLLELRKYKNENSSNFEIAALFHHLYGKGNSAAISKLELFLTEWSRSYFVFALGTLLAAP